MALQVVPSDDVAPHFKMVSSAVSTLFDDEKIGIRIHQIIDGDYETADEVIDDLQQMDDSYIIRRASSFESICNETDQSMLCKLLLRIFEDNITSLHVLFHNVTLPNALEECTVDHIQHIAMDIIETINSTAKRNTINPEKVKEFIASHEINGEYVVRTKTVDFITNAIEYSIPAGKARLLYNGIKKYKLESTNALIHFMNSKKGINHGALNWNGIMQIIDCSTEHIIYIVDKYILNEMNKPKSNKHRSKIIECITKNAFDGTQLKAMNRKVFAETIWKYCADKTLNGNAMTLWKKLINFDIPQLLLEIHDDCQHNVAQAPLTINDNITEDVGAYNISTTVLTSITELRHCNTQHIMHIVGEFISGKLQNDLLNEYKNKIMQCMEKNQVDGKQLESKTIGRKSFAEMCCKFCECTQLRSPCLKLYGQIMSFDFHQYALPLTPPALKDSETSFAVDEEQTIKDTSEKPWMINPDTKEEKEEKEETYRVQEIKQCNCEVLVYLLEHYIIKKINNEKLNRNKAQIISYFKQNHMNGADALQIGVRNLADCLAEHCKDKRVRGGSRKLYNALHGKIDLNISSVPIPIALRNSGGLDHLNVNCDPLCKEISECSANQIASDVLCSIIPNIPKLIPYKPAICEHVTKNGINGEIFLKKNRNDFVKDLIAVTGDKSIRAAACTLHKRMKTYHDECGAPQTETAKESEFMDNLEHVIDTWNKEMMQNKPIAKQQLMECMRSHHMNSDRFNKMEQNPHEWLAIMNQCDINKTTAFAIFDRLRILMFKWTRNINKMDECNNEELLYVLLKYILPMDHANTDDVIKCIKDGKMTGAVRKLQFVNQLKDKCSDIKRGHATAIYTKLHDFEWDSIKQTYH